MFCFTITPDSPSERRFLGFHLFVFFLGKNGSFLHESVFFLGFIKASVRIAPLQINCEYIVIGYFVDHDKWLGVHTCKEKTKMRTSQK